MKDQSCPCRAAATLWMLPVVWALSACWATAQPARSSGGCPAVGPVTTDRRIIPAVPPPGISQWDLTQSISPWMFGELGGPSEDTPLRVRIRVGDTGRVEAACVVGAVPPDLARMVVQRYEKLTYLPATLDGRPVSVTVEVTLTIRRAPSLHDVLSKRLAREDEDRSRGPALIAATYGSTDVAMLERLASVGPSREELSRQRWNPGLKALRTAALARLGQLGTPESLAAVDRITSAEKARGPGFDQFTATAWPHPAWHFGDGGLVPLAEAAAPDGTTFIIVRGNLYGRVELFLLSSRTPNDRTSWTRPRLVPALVMGSTSNGTVSWRSGLLDLTFDETDPSTGATPAAPPPTRQRAVTIDIAGVWRDLDQDGLSDVEERRVGLDPNNPDTDDDGLPDGADTCPMYAAPRDAPPDEAREIVQAAFFATFGVSRSRMLVKIKPGVLRVQLTGYMGPVLYSDTPPPYRDAGPSANTDRVIWLGWDIVSRTADSATVTLSDWEGSTAAGGQDVYLKKIRGRWYVVAQETTWIS